MAFRLMGIGTLPLHHERLDAKRATKRAATVPA